MMTIPAERAFQLIENIYTSVMMFDGTLRLTAINPAGENLLSISSRKVLGHTAYEIVPDSPGFADMLQRALLAKRSFTEWGMNLKLGQGRLVCVDAVFTPMLDDPEGEALIVELIDVQSFNRARREEHLSVLHEAARKSLQGMAHEIKNPLGGLRGAAQLLERELDGSELREYTRIIISEADRLRSLVDRMLVPNSKRTLSHVNIHEVLEYVQSLVVAEADARLRVERDYDPSLPPVQADRTQLIQALLNIVRNAVQATGVGGNITLRTRIKRNCTIRHRHFKMAVQIDIIDDGPGVAPEIEHDMFYPLVTTRSDGTGLGLSIAQSLVRAHNGSIEYERTDGKTCFHILLPLNEKS